MADFKWSYHEAVRDTNPKSAEESKWIELIDLLTAKLYPHDVDGYIKSRSSNLEIVATSFKEKQDVVRFPIALEAVELIDMRVLVKAITEMILNQLVCIEMVREAEKEEEVSEEYDDWTDDSEQEESLEG